MAGLGVENLRYGFIPLDDFVILSTIWHFFGKLQRNAQRLLYVTRFRLMWFGGYVRVQSGVVTAPANVRVFGHRTG
ncbi:hypothetical protein CWS02_09175 [Enterobacter sp. EA-1]|nr:hypothetical protein CWS02_09175 [Enterobacter sp. EA-1]